MLIMNIGNRGHMKDYLIFDFDGTLVDSMFYWEQSTFYFLSLYGIKPPENINKMIKEMSIQECCEFFRKEYGIDETPRQMFSKANIFMREKYDNIIPLKENVRNALDFFRASGKRMCIATATDRDVMSGAMKRLGLEGYFEFVITCGEIGASKNRPDIYLKCAEIFSENPENIAVFEDMPHCAKTSRAAGFYTIGVYDKHAESLENEMKEICDYYSYDWNEFIEK